MRCHNLIARRSEFGRRVSVRPVLSHSVVEDAKQMNTQARVCACQLRLHFFLCYETLAKVIHRNSVEWRPYTEDVQILVAYGPLSHPPGPIAQARVRLDRCFQWVPSWVLGSAADCWAAE